MLQLVGGNRAVGRLIAAGALQPKLRVGAPSDRYEREADYVADLVLRTPAPTVQRCGGCAGGVPCAECAGRDREEMTIQRVAAESGGGGGATNTADTALGDLGPGEALDAGVRGYFEPRLGHRLGDVRVHTGTRAAQAVEAVAARAFTVRHHVVFGRGEYAPHTHRGRRLLAHELVHVVQQRGAAEPVIQRERVYASGYPRRFASDWAEVGCYMTRPRCVWYPASIDFRATATNSGGGSGSDTFTALLDHIAAAAPGSITELGLMGHANVDYFGLGGRITAHDVWFSEAGLIGAESLEREKDRIAALRDRFAAGAKIVLYGCNAGSGKPLLDAISKAFQVCVQGFSNEIITCLRWRTPSREIFDRGRTWVEDPLALERPEDVGCANFHLNVRDLTPDRESCAGVPAPAAPAPTAGEPSPRRFGVELRAGAAFSDEGWRAAVDLGMRYSLRSDRAIVWNPIFGTHLVYLPSSGDRVSHIAAAIAELGVRIQQPLEGFYADIRAGGYAGLRVPGPGSAEKTEAIGGFTPALGLGYHSERLSIGAEGRGFVGAGPNQFVIVGVGAWHW